MSNTNRNWALKNKTTGQLHSRMTFPTREAARKVAQSRPYNGNYMVVRLGDGSIPSKHQPKYPKPTKPKKAETKEAVTSAAMPTCTKTKTTQSNGRPLNKAPQLRPSTHTGIGFAVSKRFL
jgi:hypothetical protein